MNSNSLPEHSVQITHKNTEHQNNTDDITEMSNNQSRPKRTRIKAKKVFSVKVTK